MVDYLRMRVSFSPHFSTLAVEMNGVVQPIYVAKRPGCDEFLQVRRCCACICILPYPVSTFSPS